MRKRVTQEEDYLPELAESIARERAKAPHAALPWEWWREQAERYGVTPNNIYSRAIKHGLYTSPRRGETGDHAGAAKNPAPLPKTGRRQREGTPGEGHDPRLPSGADKSASRAEVGAQSDKTGRKTAPPDRTAAPSARLLTERLHAMAEIADVLGEMEERIHTMERERDAETAKTREAVRALDRLARVLEEASGTVAALRRLYEG